MDKPKQGLGGLCNISLGFLGIQIGFELQNSNMSRIFQTLGASLDDLPALWIAAPLTGLLIQPLIGHYSDRTWGRFGRRRPYFVAGAVLAALALFVMPGAPALWFAAMMLWILDAALNVSMEPFRAFVGDMLRKDQHRTGYAVQTAFIGIGAVVAATFPWLLDAVGVSNVAAEGHIPDTVRYSFWFGGAALFVAVMWTVLSTREYSPEEMQQFESGSALTGGNDDAPARALASQSPVSALVWIGAGLAVAGIVWKFALEKEAFLLGGLLAAYGVARLAASALARSGRSSNILSQIVGDFAGMPVVMKRLALTQFFSWSALFIMWIYTTPVVAQYLFGSADAASAAFQDGGNWTGIMSMVRNAVAAVAALTLLPLLGRRFGNARTHMICLMIGAVSFAAFLVIRDKNAILVTQLGLGIAWASILAMPYAILANALPQNKLGVYMGLFNVFIVIPQLLVATVMGSILKAFFPTEPIWTMAFAAAVMFAASIAMLRVKEAV